MKYYNIAFYSLMQITNIQMYNNTSVQMPGNGKGKVHTITGRQGPRGGLEV
jgi:hypothetical protein